MQAYAHAAALRARPSARAPPPRPWSRVQISQKRHRANLSWDGALEQRSLAQFTADSCARTQCTPVGGRRVSAQASDDPSARRTGASAHQLGSAMAGACRRMRTLPHRTRGPASERCRLGPGRAYKLRRFDIVPISVGRVPPTAVSRRFLCGQLRSHAVHAIGRSSRERTRLQRSLCSGRMRCRPCCLGPDRAYKFSRSVIVPISVGMVPWSGRSSNVLRGELSVHAVHVSVRPSRERMRLRRSLCSVHTRIRPSAAIGDGWLVHAGVCACAAHTQTPTLPSSQPPWARVRRRNYQRFPSTCAIARCAGVDGRAA